MADWGIKDWLEALAYAITIGGGVAGSFIYLQNFREESIAMTKKEIVRTWTNEGDIASKEITFITLELENVNGDIVGSLSTNAYNGVFEVHAEVGWLMTTLKISELQGRTVATIATVKAKLTGNNNRLEWSVTGNQGTEILPKQTTLWPSEIGVSR